MFRQHARFLPQHLAPPVSFNNPLVAAPTPGDPRPPAERRRSIVFGCDIDHTLINQAHAVLPRVMGGWYPETFPPWSPHSPPPNAIQQSDALMRYIMTNKKTLHITNFSDNNKSWPESARVRCLPARMSHPSSARPYLHAASSAPTHRATPRSCTADRCSRKRGGAVTSAQSLNQASVGGGGAAVCGAPGADVWRLLQALRMADKSDSEVMLALIDQVVEHVRRRRAFLVVTPVRFPPSPRRLWYLPLRVQGPRPPHPQPVWRDLRSSCAPGGSGAPLPGSLIRM